MISDIKIWPVQGNKVVKANGSFVVSNAFRINFAIIQGKNGLFVSLPQEKYEKDGKTEYAPKVACISKEMNTEMTNKVLAAFTGGKTTSDQGVSAEPTSQTTRKSANVPF